MKPNEGTLGIITERDVEAPMRDGVILRAHIFRPDHPGQYPALLHRTPYGKHTSGYDRYVRAGYVVVSQDARGRYSSDGDYIPFTEPHSLRLPPPPRMPDGGVDCAKVEAQLNRLMDDLEDLHGQVQTWEALEHTGRPRRTIDFRRRAKNHQLMVRR